MEWKQFTEAVDKVKKLTTKIQGETDKIMGICTEYNNLLNDEKATPKECEDFSQLTECLAEIQKNLENVKGKEASTNINIEFVGTTSSGKSSLINALLRERRLPVGFMQTTMCSFKVCTTEQKEWSVTATDENGKTVVLSVTNDEKAIKELLSKLSGPKHSKDREERNINTRSIVQINWPKHLCEVLPSNVVLFDTPGIGEDKESDKVVTQSCEKADIIIAVMDPQSPTKKTVTDLVKNANCQFTFGVFTKWDECQKKAQEEEREEENEATTDLEQAREDYEKEFRKAVENKCEVFFVDVKRVRNNDEGFKAFEGKLATSATKLKGESLIKQAKALNVKSTEISKKFKDIVTTRKEAKIASLEKKLVSIKGAINAFNEMSETLRRTKEIEDIFSEEAKTELLQEFEKAVMSGKSERDALDKFVKKVNNNVKDNMASKRNDLETRLGKWAESLKQSTDLNMNTEMVPKEDDPQFQQFENQALPEDQYNCYRDPNNYYTNNYVMGGALLFLATAVGFGGGVALAGYMAAEALGFAGAGTFVGGAAGVLGSTFRLGDKLKKISPISDYKMGCWRESLGREWDKLHKDCRERISLEIDRIHDNYAQSFRCATNCTSKEIKALHAESHNLTIWAKQVDGSHKYFQKTISDLDMLLAELKKREKEMERAEEERRHQMEDKKKIAVMMACNF